MAAALKQSSTTVPAEKPLFCLIGTLLVHKILAALIPISATECEGIAMVTSIQCAAPA
jgi:hypothetical protein